MKKFLSYALVAMMLVAVVAVSVSALTWRAGEGLWVHEGASYGDAQPTVHSPVVVTENADGSITVEQGGYWKAPYMDSGVATKEKVGLDGLSVTVKFEEAPAPTIDCWFAIHLINKPQLFTTDGETLGYKNLIRFADPKMEYYAPAWGGLGASDIGANDNIFAIQTGDVITMNVNYEYGQYIVSYVHETATGTKTFTVPADKTLDVSNEVFNESGEAHVSVAGSLLGADSDWKYTITVVPGKGLSEEEKATQAFERSKLSTLTAITDYAVAIEKHVANAQAAIEGKANPMDDASIAEGFAALEAATADVAAAKAALEAAATEEDVAAALAIAEAAKAEASKAEDQIVGMAELLADASDEPVVEDEPVADDEPVVEDEEEAEEAEEEAPAKKAGFPVVPVVIVVVVVIAVVAILATKKKKN